MVWKEYLENEGFSTLESVGMLLWAINQIVEDKKSGVPVKESVEALIKDSWAKISLFLVKELFSRDFIFFDPMEKT